VAVAAPSSIGAVGPLCYAYQADMFFDHAELCYERAANWRRRLALDLLPRADQSSAAAESVWQRAFDG